MTQHEHREQVALFQWAKLSESRIPQLKLLYAIPNAARRSPRHGAWMKAEGLRAGMPDVHLPVMSGTIGGRQWCGLWIEMKAGKNKPTDTQLAVHLLLRMYGHRVEVSYDWLNARALICQYLGVPA